jgi:DNA-directed RNA polymerase subunit RPC12/RpoP
MAVVMLRLPEVEPDATPRPRHCPYCGSQILQRWGRVSKILQDTQYQETEVQRYRCCECKRTFRDYPEGVDRANQTLRIRHLAALAWALGLSTRDIVEVFDDLGVRLSRMSVWRDGQGLLARVNANGEHALGPGFSIARVDPKKINGGPGVVIVIDLGHGKPLVLGVLDEHNPRVVSSWLQPLINEIDVQLSLLETGFLHRITLTTGELALQDAS